MRAGDFFYDLYRWIPWIIVVVAGIGVLLMAWGLAGG